MVCVGCWFAPSPAFITGTEETSDAYLALPSSGCLMTMRSA